MLCNKCRKQNPEGSRFCLNCGSVLNNEMNSQNISLAEAKLLHCPRCKSKKVQMVYKANAQGGYRVCRGCLGYLLLGPLGLLCGVLGKKAKVSITNNTLYVCTECRCEFSYLDDMIERKEKEMKSFLISGIIVVILGIVFLLKSFDLEAAFWSVFFGSVLFIASWGTKKQRDELLDKGYDASCYLKSS